jgi:hypothetical protein
MKIYSPSQTVTAMKCPMLNSLQREGWRLRDQGKPLLAQIVGKAIAAGLGIYNGYRKSYEKGGNIAVGTLAVDRSGISKSAMECALVIMAQEMTQIEKLGYILTPASEDYLKTMQDRVCKSILHYIANDLIPANWRIVDVECNLGEGAGNARPDLIVRDNNGALGVVDYKTLSEYKTQYYRDHIEAYRDSFQMKHYMHFGQKVYNESIERFYIASLITQPVKQALHTFEVNPESLELWYQATTGMWQYMEQVELGQAKPWMASEHKTRFGECEMYAMCFRYRFDEQAAKHKYIRIEKDIE